MYRVLSDMCFDFITDINFLSRIQTIHIKYNNFKFISKLVRAEIDADSTWSYRDKAGIIIKIVIATMLCRWKFKLNCLSYTDSRLLSNIKIENYHWISYIFINKISFHYTLIFIWVILYLNIVIRQAMLKSQHPLRQK